MNESTKELKELLARRDPAFWSRLGPVTASCDSLSDLLLVSGLRKKASDTLKLEEEEKGRKALCVAMVGGCTLFPLNECVEHLLFVEGYAPRIVTGEYDNYVAELTNEGSPIYGARPDVLVFFPSETRCAYSGSLADPPEGPPQEAERLAAEILGLCRTFHERAGAEIMLANFKMPARLDPGAYRARTAASDWSFRKLVNTCLGSAAPSYVTLCDLEFLSCRRGTLASEDARRWFESKQLGSEGLILDVARELAHLVVSLKRGPKKVLVLDLDNTLWGGVVGDDGLTGIELGDTSPRGEAFKAFQRYVRTLTQRGVLLAVCSKNERETAEQPFKEHPEMVLKLEDFVSFKANWRPKSDNLIEMASELNLGLDSFVFADDNPAEIEIVRQFAPEVATICLGSDPAEFTSRLQDARLFEPRSITEEDAVRTTQYRSEAQRQAHKTSFADMGEYLQSLEMEAEFSEFKPVDVPRIAQLVNRSNQFNLTTRRRTEAEVQAVAADPNYVCVSARLRDKFGDHGLVSVVIGRICDGGVMEIDTWLMSCRVLERQLEEEILNEMARLARARRAREIRGEYIPTKKNKLVEKHYDRLGFAAVSAAEGGKTYRLSLEAWESRPTRIKVVRHAYE